MADFNIFFKFFTSSEIFLLILFLISILLFYIEYLRINTHDNKQKVNKVNDKFVKFEKKTEEIVNLINDFNNGADESFVICVDSKWGNGKTTLINQVKQEIQKESKILWIDYEPWHFQDGSELIEDYFLTLKKEIKRKFEINIFFPSNYISKLTPKVETSFLGGIVNVSLTFSIFLQKTLGETKIQIKKNFKKVDDKKIVVFIDDLDRMMFKEVMIVLKIVKLLSDFPHIIFILPFDYLRVSSLIKNELGRGYQNYLQKIIHRKVEFHHGYNTLFNIFKMNFDNKDEKEIQELFDKFILFANIKRYKEWTKRAAQAKGIALNDPYYLDFSKLFYRLNLEGNIDELWDLKGGSNENFYQNEIRKFYKKWSDIDVNKNLTLLDLEKDIYLKIALWQSYKFLESISSEIRFLDVEGNGDDRKILSERQTDVDQVLKISSSDPPNTPNKDFFNRLLGMFETYPQIYYKENSVSTKHNRKEKLVFEIKKFYNNYYSDDNIKFNEYRDKFFIRDWIVTDLITPRDVFQLSKIVKDSKKYKKDIFKSIKEFVDGLILD